MVQQNCQEETTNSESPLSAGNKPQGGEISVENFKANGRESQPTSGRSKVSSSIAITMNIEFKFTCRRKKHSLFYCNEFILIWICYKRRGLTIIGMSIRAETSVNFLERIRKIHSNERETSKRIYVVRRKTDKDSCDCQT